MRYDDPIIIGQEKPAEKTPGRDDRMLLDVDLALSEIQALLGRLHEIAEQAKDPAANREALTERFESIKAEIDKIAEDRCSKWSAAEATHLRKLVAGLDSNEL